MNMDAFWNDARTMLRWKNLIILGFVCAFISAGGVGAGLFAALPIIETIMEPGHEGLPQLARDLNEH